MDYNWSQDFSQYTNLFLCKESIKYSRSIALCKLFCLQTLYLSSLYKPWRHTGEWTYISHSKIQRYILGSGQLIPVMSHSHMDLGLHPQTCWTHRRRENLLLLLGIEPRFLSYPYSNVVTILTILFRLYLSLSIYIYIHTHTHTYIYMYVSM